MSSAARRLARAVANRANARLSTGPVTEAGKAISSQNATKHGLTGKQLVIPGEDPTAYDALRANLYQSYDPANEAEKILVDQIGVSAWRLQRAQKIEASALTQLAGSKGLAAIFIEDPTILIRIQRYLTCFERAYYKAIKELQLLQKGRLQQQEEQAKQKVGFVSKSLQNPVDSLEDESEFTSDPGPSPVQTRQQVHAEMANLEIRS